MLQIEPARFPALDPEPPPRPRWYRPLIRGNVAVLTAAVIATIALWPSDNMPAAPPAPTALSNVGVVVVWRESGSLAISAPNGTQIRHPTAAQSAPAYPVSSPDGRFAVDTYNNLWALGVDGARLVNEQAWGGGLVNEMAAQPFAANGHYLVSGGTRLYGGGADPAQLRVPGSQQSPRSVGPPAPDEVAGDPVRPAVLVSLPVGLAVAVGSTFHQADRQVDYVPLRGKARTLLTEQRARTLLGLSGRVELFAWPSQDGRKTAVRVRELTGGDAGVVVLDTTSGHVDKTFRIAKSVGALAWSFSGSLAVVTSFPGQLSVWANGALRRITLHLPVGEHFGGECSWSPDEKVMLCPTFGAARVSHWLLVRIADGRQQVVVAAGTPVAWIGSPT